MPHRCKKKTGNCEHAMHKAKQINKFYYKNSLYMNCCNGAMFFTFTYFSAAQSDINVQKVINLYYIHLLTNNKTTEKKNKSRMDYINFIKLLK